MHNETNSFAYDNSESLKIDNSANLYLSLSPSGNVSSLRLVTTEEMSSVIRETGLEFVNQAASAYTKLALPSSLKLEDYTISTVGYRLWNIATGDQLGVHANITSLQALPVPEMPIWVLMLGGLFAARLAIFGRRRTSNI
ncbi:MAG TPA: hypothetical protein VIZ65_02795 [Cellvibrionaceae bacterium]